MIRNSLLELLRRYIPIDEEERAYHQKIIKFVMDYSDCFERSLEVGHVTASAWLLNKTANQALLMHHAKLNRWCQPGGHCDGNPNVIAVALQEAQEESGISQIIPVVKEIFDLDVHFIPAQRGVQEHYHYDIRFLLQVISEEEAVGNNESKGLCWVSRDRKEIYSLTKSQSVLRMWEKWMSFQPCLEK